jgi:hypothetical protein
LQQARPIQLWFQRLDGSTTAAITTLSATITSTDTTITVASATNLPSAGFILIGTETIYFGYATGNILYNCVRAQNGTTAAAHTAGDSVYMQNLPCVTVWPTPDDSQTYTLIYWRMRRIDDAGGGVNTMDVPFRFLNCLVAGLAYYLALKVPNAMVRLDVLKSQYDEAWELASTEDRETAALRFVPRQTYI